jgi:hypothetical protein
MVYRVLITLMLLVSINGCVFAKHQNSVGQNKPILMTDIYIQSVGDAKKDVSKKVEQSLKEHKTFGYVKPYIPVVVQPVVRKVWVPDHKLEADTSILVGGHWGIRHA